MASAESILQWLMTHSEDPDSGLEDAYNLVKALQGDAGGVGFEPSSGVARDLLGGADDSEDVGLFVKDVDSSEWEGKEDAGQEVNTNAGELSLGGLNPSLYTGEVNYLQVVNSSAWQVALCGMKVGSKPVLLSPSPVAQFHTEQVIFMKASLANATMALVPGSNITSKNDVVDITVPCDTRTTFTFTFGGRDYTLPPENWVVQPFIERRDGCACRISSMPDSSMTSSDVYLGSAFLSTVYTALKFGEPPQIGFAKLSAQKRSGARRVGGVDGLLGLVLSVLVALATF